jgi:hypothetical protein
VLKWGGALLFNLSNDDVAFDDIAGVCVKAGGDIERSPGQHP